jgi:tetratricopeptide (TPR) repeat protein
MLEGAVAAFRRAYGPDDLRAVRAELALGWLLVGMDALDEAEATLARSAARIKGLVGERTQLYATCVYDQALLHLARKEPDVAQALFRDAARIFVEAGGPAAPQRGWALSNAAGIDFDRGRWHEALAGYEETLAAWRDTMPADAVVVGSMWDNIARIHLELRQLDQATAANDRALAILDRPERQLTQNLAEALEARGEIEAARGGDAAPWFRRALEIGERAFPKDSRDLVALRERTTRSARH